MEHSLVTLVRLCDCSFRLEPDFVVLILLVYLYTDIMIYIHTYIYIYIYITVDRSGLALGHVSEAYLDKLAE